MWTINLCLLCLVTILSGCEAYKILVVFPMPSRSHGNLGDGIVRHLLKAGHEVSLTFILNNKSKCVLFGNVGKKILLSFN